MLRAPKRRAGAAHPPFRNRRGLHGSRYARSIIHSMFP
jgi:hypothetical protein